MDNDLKTILCYGDSNTYGYDPVTGLRYPESIRWPSVLRTMLAEDKGWGSGSGREYRVIEEGCNGRTASVTPEDEPWKDGRGSLKVCLNSHKPIHHFILMLGSNDLKTSFGRSAADITAGIREILQTVADFTLEKQGFTPEVLLIAPPHLGDGIETSPFAYEFDEDSVARSRQLPQLYEAEAKAFGAGFLDASKIIETSETDSLHLMPDAHRRLAEAVRDIITEQTE